MRISDFKVKRYPDRVFVHCRVYRPGGGPENNRVVEFDLKDILDLPAAAMKAAVIAEIQSRGKAVFDQWMLEDVPVGPVDVDLGMSEIDVA